MLSAHKAPKACQSCRLQLLRLFENGFAKPTASNVSRVRYSTSRPRALQPRPHSSIRRFSTTRIRAEETKRDTYTVNVLTPEEIEAVVKQARQTFGETLPKDYLSAEEYVLYERLYGPPLRETRPEDLEYIPDGEEIGTDGKRRSFLQGRNALGEMEEVELDKRFGFSVTRRGMDELDSNAGYYERNLEAEQDVDDLESAAELYEDDRENIESTSDLVEEEMLEGEEDNPEKIEYESDLVEEEILTEESEGPILGHEIIVEEESPVDEAMLREIEAKSLADETKRIQAERRNQREIDAIAMLQKDMDAALAQPVEEEDEISEEYEEEEVEQEEEEEYEEDDPNYVSSDEIRTHPHTMAGRMGTNPKTLTLPDELVVPITELLARTNPTHLMNAAEKAFGGRGLPYSSSVPGSKKHLPQKNIGLDAFQHRMTEIEADSYLAAVMPQTYTAVMSTLVEVRKRLGSSWIRDLISKRKTEGPRVLDAGAGGGGAIALREIVQAEWDILRDEGAVQGETAPGKTTVLTGPNTLRHRVSKFMDNTTFIPRLPDHIPSSSHGKQPEETSQPRKLYDIIIAPHTLFPLKEEFRRKNMVQNLWSLLDPNGGVLILIEKGLPRGFEAIAGARSLLLDSHISSPGETATENEIQSPTSGEFRFNNKEEGMIIAPCTNHSKCPMYPIPGLSSGRKDFCHFGQRFTRPGFLQRVLGASQRNHEDVKFSYIAVRRGIDARRRGHPLLEGEKATDLAFEGYEDYDLPGSEGFVDGEPSDIKFNTLSLPRAILPPLKRRGHVTLDLCTPSGRLERWTVPKSFSKAAYRDARKSSWGDLWALGAKTRTIRKPRLGRLGEDGKIKGIRDGKMGRGGKKFHKNKFNILMGKDGMEGIELDRSQSKFVKREKRTKGGRIWKEPKPIGEDDI